MVRGDPGPGTAIVGLSIAVLGLAAVLAGSTGVMAAGLAVPGLAGAAPAPPRHPGEAFGNVLLHANLDEHPSYTDIWGYTSPSGSEYALLATTGGLAVIALDDLAAPRETGFIPGPGSNWRDVKSYRQWAYVVNESSGGLAIVDLADPEAPVSLPPWDGIVRAHNLYVDEASARAFIAGSDRGIGGVRILSLADPANPTEIGSWEGEYLHDVYVSGNRLYGCAINTPRLVILDIADPAAPVVLDTIGGYPNAKTHNAWSTADDSHVLTTDETSAGAVRMWDVSNLPGATLTATYKPNAGTVPHNAHIEGDLAFVSFYTLGVKILDVSSPTDLVEVASFDTWLADDGPSFDGCWGVFPFFGTRRDLFVASDRASGLWVLEYKGRLGALEGTVFDTAKPATGIAGATVELPASGLRTESDASGSYRIEDAPGWADLSVSAFGFAARTLPARIVAGLAMPRDVGLARLPGGRLAGVVREASTGTAIVGAAVEVSGSPLVSVTDTAGGFDFPHVPAGSWTLRARAFGYGELEADVSVAPGSDVLVDLPLPLAFVAEDFEAPDPSWTVSGDATRGLWQRGDPAATFSGGVPVQPGDDHTPPPGVNAWITDVRFSGDPNTYDVDDGATLLLSPAYDLTGLPNARVAFHRWYSTGVGDPDRDDWVVEVSRDAGFSWTTLERRSRAEADWVRVEADVFALVGPSAFTRFRFTAQDTGRASLTEAGLDDFTIYAIETLEPRRPTPEGSPVHGGIEGAGIAGHTGSGAPAAVSLGKAVPNPVGPGSATRWSLTLPSASPVTATIHDVTGRRVARLLDGRLSAGVHELSWDGRSASGARVASGVYFLRLNGAGSRAGAVRVLR